MSVNSRLVGQMGGENGYFMQKKTATEDGL